MTNIIFKSTSFFTFDSGINEQVIMSKNTCFHCGLDVTSAKITFDDKAFCRYFIK